MSEVRKRKPRNYDVAKKHFNKGMTNDVTCFQERKFDSVRELTIGLHNMKVTGDLDKNILGRLVVIEAQTEWVAKTRWDEDEGN